jgi:hypothetical protein
MKFDINKLGHYIRGATCIFLLAIVTMYLLSR